MHIPHNQVLLVTWWVDFWTPNKKGKGNEAGKQLNQSTDYSHFESPQEGVHHRHMTNYINYSGEFSVTPNYRLVITG